MRLTKKAANKFIEQFNEIFEELEELSDFDGKVNSEWYINSQGIISIVFDSPIKEALAKLCSKNCPSWWTRLKEIFLK